MRGAAASPSERAGAVPVRGPSSPGGPGLDVSSLTCGRGDRSLRPPFCEAETMQCWPERDEVDAQIEAEVRLFRWVLAALLALGLGLLGAAAALTWG